ncbi:MAG: hypothetical protein L0Z62_36035 [Gemmataceae bacterium]|nr:hypothetical protein [Gemmataceae bacterium]
MASATREELLVQGHSARLVRKVESGKMVKLILSRDESGEARSWVELTVTELEHPEKAAEGVSLGTAKPAPREQDVIRQQELPPVRR